MVHLLASKCARIYLKFNNLTTKFAESASFVNQEAILKSQILFLAHFIYHMKPEL